MAAPIPAYRRFRPTPAWLIFGLLVAEGLLWLSERYRWFWFNEKKGWTVLIAVASVGVTMLIMLLWFVVSLLFRWRFQFSVRSVLVLTLAVALPCSWLGVEMQGARKQREAMEMFAVSDCIVWCDDLSDDTGALDMHKLDATQRLTQARSTVDPPLVDLLGWNFFHAVAGVAIGKKDLIGTRCERPEVAQATLPSLKNLLDLRCLDLSDIPINNSDLELVMPLKVLRQLVLTGTNVTDEGVKKLQQAMPNCQIYSDVDEKATNP